nr:MAG TPA: hypothetical protein [Caudoviricetes sp.]
MKNWKNVILTKNALFKLDISSMRLIISMIQMTV